MNSTDPARMKNSPVFHNAVFTSLRSASTALSIPAGAATQTADKMPMMVISLSRYSRYCFASILVYRAANAHWEAETFYLPLCLPPILKNQIDPGFLNGLKILSVARYKRPIQPNGYRSNQAIW